MSDVKETYIIRKWDTTQNSEIEVRDRVYFPGYETGKLVVVRKENNVLIVRESGYKYFVMRGKYAYAPPSLYVGLLDRDEFHVYEVIEYNRESMKSAKEKANEVFNRLCKQTSSSQQSL